MLITTCCVAAFLTGGIPFGYLVGRMLLKDDIRRHGSGNIGATNVGRVLGWKWGSLVLFLDALKGLLPTLGARLWTENQQWTEQHVLYVTVATGVCAIVGHMYPVYLKLRGGKGVATALGVVLIIAPWPTAMALLAFVLTFVFSRVVALSSIMAALCFSVAHLAIAGRAAWSATTAPVTAFAIVVPALIVWRHRSNIARLFAGSEKRFTVTGGRSDPPKKTPTSENSPREST